MRCGAAHLVSPKGCADRAEVSLQVRDGLGRPIVAFRFDLVDVQPQYIFPGASQGICGDHGIDYVDGGDRERMVVA